MYIHGKTKNYQMLSEFFLLFVFLYQIFNFLHRAFGFCICFI